MKVDYHLFINSAARTSLHLESGLRQPAGGAFTGPQQPNWRWATQAVPLPSLRRVAPGPSASRFEEDIVIGSRDTSVAARTVQLQAFRRLSSAERVAIAMQMSEEARRVATDGLRHRHPEMTSSEIDDAMRRLLRRAE